MVRKTYTPEQIINKLREVEVLISQGVTTGEASRKAGITEQTYYRRPLLSQACLLCGQEWDPFSAHQSVHLKTEARRKGAQSEEEPQSTKPLVFGNFENLIPSNICSYPLFTFSFGFSALFFRASRNLDGTGS